MKDGPNLDLEDLGHELLFAVRELAEIRTNVNARIGRIVSVTGRIQNLLPSTRDAIVKAAETEAKL